MASIAQASLDTPIGPIRVAADGERLTRIEIGAGAEHPGSADPLLEEAVRQLRAWFDGRLGAFDLPLEPPATPRGAAHRAAIAAIGYGCTASYGEIAQAIGSGPRAVGQACRRNPFPLIVPCHRVVGAGGTIGHYSAGEGLTTKRWLLQFEAKGARAWPA